VGRSARKLIIIKLIQKKNAASNTPRFAYSVGHCLFILLYWAEAGKNKIEDDSKIDRETNLDRRGPSQIGTD
jgi:hypothetical protein